LYNRHIIDTMKTKNYLEIYKFQEGGPAPAPAPAQGGGAPPIEEMIMQALQSGDGQMALEVLGMIAEQMGLSAATAPQGAPAGPPEGAPMGKYGMKVPVLSNSIIG
jgi:hypothetical protein